MMNMNEDFFDNTIANLKIISMLQKNQKLCVRKGQLTLEREDRLQFIRRWFHSDSRDHILMHVRNSINNAIKIAKSLTEKENSTYKLKDWTLTKIMEEMEQAENGLINLKTTYAGDSIIIANLDVLIDRLKVNGEEIKKNLELHHKIE